MAYITAAGALVDTCAFSKGARVLITAPSSTGGIAAIQVARMIGTEPIAFTSSPQKVGQIKELGAGDVVLQGDGIAGIAAASAGEGVDLAFDCVRGALTPCIVESLRPRSTLIQYGALDARRPALPVMSLLKNSLTVGGFRYGEIVSDAEVRQRIVALSLQALSPAF